MEDSKKFIFDMSLTVEDVWHFSIYHGYRGLYGVFNILFSLVSVVFVVIQWNDFTWAQRIVFIFCALLFSVIQPSLMYLKAKKQAANPAIKNGVKIEADDKIIKVTQDGTTGEFVWDKIFKTMIKKELIIIYLDPIRAYLIPKRYWGQDILEFEEILKMKTKVQKF